MLRGWSLALAMILIGLAPLTGSALAGLAECGPLPGGGRSCVLLGFDWTGLVDLLDLVGRYAFLAVPVAVGGFVLGIGLALGALVRRGRD